MIPNQPMSHDPVFLSIRVDRALKAQLNDAAKVNGVKPSDLVRYIVSQWLDAYHPVDECHVEDD